MFPKARNRSFNLHACDITKKFYANEVTLGESLMVSEQELPTSERPTPPSTSWKGREAQWLSLSTVNDSTTQNSGHPKITEVLYWDINMFREQNTMERQYESCKHNFSGLILCISLMIEA